MFVLVNRNKYTGNIVSYIKEGDYGIPDGVNLRQATVYEDRGSALEYARKNGRNADYTCKWGIAELTMSVSDSDPFTKEEMGLTYPQGTDLANYVSMMRKANREVSVDVGVFDFVVSVYFEDTKVTSTFDLEGNISHIQDDDTW